MKTRTEDATCSICEKPTVETYFDGEDHLPCCPGQCQKDMDELLALRTPEDFADAARRINSDAPNEYLDAEIAKLFKQAMAESAPKWQPVTETSPPGDYEPVLGYCKNAQGINVYRRSIQEANPDNPESTKFFEEWYTGTEELIDDEDYYPTHWMPVPEPPKE